MERRNGTKKELSANARRKAQNGNKFVFVEQRTDAHVCVCVIYTIVWVEGQRQ